MSEWRLRKKHQGVESEMEGKKRELRTVLSYVLVGSWWWV